jgi:hypothetical protein
VKERAMTDLPSLLHIRLADYHKGFIRIENPERFHPGLKGYLLENYGVLLPVELHRSQFPSLTYFLGDGSQVATFVILSTCVFRPGSQVIGWIDWRAHPLKSFMVNTDFASSDGHEEEKVQTCLRILQRGMKRGRPIGSGYHPTPQAFETATRQAITDLLDQGVRKIGHSDIAGELGLSRSHFSYLCKCHKLDLSTLIPQHYAKRRPASKPPGRSRQQPTTSD